MSETKWTPGPWRVWNGIDIYPTLDDNRARHHIADCSPDSPEETDTTFEERRANAQLIATTPRLYTELQYVRNYASLADLGEETISRIDAVLAEARGVITV